MSKRFTDTCKWKKPFIKGLTAPYKLFWFYILDDCDHAGIWQVEPEVASIRIGFDIDVKEAIKIFGNRIKVIDEYKWFIPDFILFQYGKLNPENRAHKSVITILEKFNIKDLISPLQGAKDKDKDKDMVKDKDKVKEELEIFRVFRKNYPSTKGGAEVEFTNFKKKHGNWKEILPKLLPSLEYQIKQRNKWPEDSHHRTWKNLRTWINQSCWDEEVPEPPKEQGLPFG